MKHTRKDLGNNKIEYRVEIAPEDVARHHNAAVKKLSRDVRVAGFRKGHVPPEIAAKHVDPSALNDQAVNTAVNATLVELINVEQLQLLDRPDVTVTKFVPAQTLEFTAVMQIVPSVKLANPKKLTAKKPPVTIDSQDVDAVIERLRTNSATKKEVKRAAENGDEVLIDFTGIKDGVEFDGGQAKDYTLVLGSNSLIPGFEDGIVGQKSGAKFDLPLKFPKDYGVKNLAGAAVVFKIVLKKVSSVKLPELDDKFASTVAPDFKTLIDLRNDIKKGLTARAEQESLQKFQNNLLDELVEKSTVEVPEILIEDQSTALEKQFSENLAYRGLTVDKYLEQEKLTRDEWVEKELRPAAEKRAKTGLAIAQLTREWGITVSDEEVAAAQARILAQYNDPKLIERFSSPEALDQIRNDLAIAKVLQRLAELNS
ncbi:trigger factor [Candidatus Saccharibacteria bacterium]|nr:trigger factor [Candidatus Saccharibacteria bacterium]